jgi:hypothetical protein
VYRNTTTDGNRWIQLDVRDSSVGTNALGVRVTVYRAWTGIVAGADEVRTDYSYRSKRTPVLHCGLGSADSVDVLVLKPHNGGQTWFYDRTANMRHTRRISESETDSDGDGHLDGEDTFP